MVDLETKLKFVQFQSQIPMILLNLVKQKGFLKNCRLLNIIEMFFYAVSAAD